MARQTRIRAITQPRPIPGWRAWALPIGLIAGAVLLPTPAANAAPLVLYNPTPDAVPAPTPAQKPPTQTALRPCVGTLANPCTGLDIRDTLVAPILPPSFEYGMSGIVTAGVSNHGYGGGVGVSAWLKKDDFILAISLYNEADHWDGKNNGYGYGYGPPFANQSSHR